MNIPAIKAKFPAFVKIPKWKMPPFSFPQKPWEKLKALTKKNRVLVFEINEEWLKIAGVAEAAGKRSITCLTVLPIKDLSDLDISLKIAQFLKEKVFKPTQAIISHPTYNLTTRILALPSTDPKEIKDILDLQAVKQTPYTKEEITTGFQIIDSDASGYSRVLLAISHRDVASRYFKVAELANLPVETITLSLEGTKNWYQLSRAKEAKEAKQIVLLLDVDGVSTDFLIMSGEKLVFSRNFGVGAKHIKERGAVGESDFLREVQLSIESGNPELKGEKITHVVLTGMGETLKDLLALLSRELNLPCEAIPVFRELGPWITALPQDVMSDGSASLAAVLGLALVSEASKINLIPPEIEIRKGLEHRAKDLGIMGTLLITLVMMLSVVSFQKVYKRSNYLNSLSKQYAAIHTQAQEVERLVAKMTLSQEQMNPEGGFLDVLHDVNEVIPDNIYLTSFQFNEKDKTVVIHGISQEMSSVFQLLSTLEATPHLESVKTRSVNKSKVGEKDVAEFEIAASIGNHPKTTVTAKATETVLPPAPAPAPAPAEAPVKK